MLHIGDEIYVHGYIDEIRKDIVIIRNGGGFFGTAKSEITKAYLDGYSHELWLTSRNRAFREALEIIDEEDEKRRNELGVVGRSPTELGERIRKRVRELMEGGEG